MYCDVCTLNELCKKIIGTMSFVPNCLVPYGAIEVTRNIDTTKYYYQVVSRIDTTPVQYTVEKSIISGRKSYGIVVSRIGCIRGNVHAFGSCQSLFLEEKFAEDFAKALNEQAMEYFNSKVGDCHVV